MIGNIFFFVDTSLCILKFPRYDSDANATFLFKRRPHVGESERGSDERRLSPRN